MPHRYYHSFFVIAIFMLSLALLPPGSAVAQGTANPGAVKKLLQRFAGRIPGYDRTIPTLLLVTSADYCAGCGASAMNAAIKSALADSLHYNIMVLIGTSVKNEGKALRKLFVTPNVFEDDAGMIQRTLPLSNGGSELFVVNSAGRILYHQGDLQRNLRSIEEYFERQKRDAMIERPAVNDISELRVKEGDDYVSDMTTPYLDPQSHRILFIEPRTNAVHSIDIGTGRLSTALDSTKQFDLHYRTTRIESDSQIIWKTFADNYFPLTPFSDILRAHGDTLVLLAKMLTGYNITIQTNGRPMALMHRQSVLLTVAHDSALSFAMLPDSRYIILPPLIQHVRRSFVSSGLWAGYDADSVARRAHLDSMYALLLIDSMLSDWRPVIRWTDLEHLYGYEMFPMYVRYIVSCGSNGLIYLDDGNGAFVRTYDSGGIYRAERLTAQGALADLLRESGESQRTGASSGGDPSVTLGTGGMLEDAGPLVVLYRERGRKAAKELIVQRYDSMGNYRREVIYPLKSIPRNDDIEKVHAVGVDGSTLYVLLKSKRLRWQLLKVPV